MRIYNAELCLLGAISLSGNMMIMLNSVMLMLFAEYFYAECH